MALRATIYKAELNVADADRHYYGSHALTLARHPSETEERLMVRVLAFALHAHEDLAFTKGLSDADEPDIWLKDLTGSIELWIEVGQPDERRILKACGRAKQVVIYCYSGQNSKIWWDGIRNKLAAQTQRSMILHANIQDGEVFISNDQGQITFVPEVWREAKD
jgi:uncharacterized protein YaeQ